MALIHNRRLLLRCCETCRKGTQKRRRNLLGMLLLLLMLVRRRCAISLKSEVVLNVEFVSGGADTVRTLIPLVNA